MNKINVKLFIDRKMHESYKNIFKNKNHAKNFLILSKDNYFDQFFEIISSINQLIDIVQLQETQINRLNMDLHQLQENTETSVSSNKKLVD
jgi:hypothetical protein